MRAPWCVRRGEAGYPDCLEDLDERAPAALWGLGDRELLATLAPEGAVTIVGARRSGAYGRNVARELGRGGAAAGLIVVSGMALGCDSEAHRGALEAGGVTIAVLGCGPDLPYPRSEASLHREILAQGGAVIAEQPPGTEPKPSFFPERNRIMAALAGVVVVVEGAMRSGTLHTAREATDLGRDVGAVPGPVTSTLSELPNHLLHSGAPVIRDAQDLLDLGIGVGRVSVRNVGPALDESLRPVLDAVAGGAATCDAVALEVGAQGGEAAVALARLELMGYVEADAVGRFARTSLDAPGSVID